MVQIHQLCATHKNSPRLTVRNVLEVTLILEHAVAHMKIIGVGTDGNHSPQNYVPLALPLF